jgi:hypothetical protein
MDRTDGNSRIGASPRWAVVAMLAAVVVAGCSGGDDSSGGPTEESAASSSTTAVESSTASSDLSATGPTTTSSTSTSSTTSSTSTTSTSTTSTSTTSTSTTSTTAVPSIEEVRLNELQVIGSHNSYHLAPESAVWAGLEAIVPTFAAELDYTHRPLDEQLGLFGIRQFEFDVYADPEGGHFSRRVGLEVVGEPSESGRPELDEPGFKVMHVQDIDFRSTCLTLVACLGEIEAWSSANPTHVPIHVMIEIKAATIEEVAEDSGFELPDLGVVWTEPVATTAELLTDLEAEILSVFDRDRIITPDDVRGEFAALPEAIAADGWPTLRESRGKALFSLINRDGTDDLYRMGSPALEGRLLFTNADPGDPDAAFVRFDDPIADSDAIADALAGGYLVRTRSDEPGTPQDDILRRDAALASGAQYVSTDVYNDVGRGFVVRLPGDVVVRCNPVTRSDLCIDAELGE